MSFFFTPEEGTDQLIITSEPPILGIILSYIWNLQKAPQELREIQYIYDDQINLNRIEGFTTNEKFICENLNKQANLGKLNNRFQCTCQTSTKYSPTPTGGIAAAKTPIRGPILVPAPRVPNFKTPFDSITDSNL